MPQDQSLAERAAWDEGFRKNGRKYGGSPRDLPALPPGTRVLEAGCGDGKSLLSMAGRGWEIVALDHSGEALRICSGHHSLYDVAFLKADVRALPFAGESFPMVFLTHVLGHLPLAGRVNAASEAERVVVRGGSVLVRVFSQRDFRKGKGVLVEPHTYLRGDSICTHYFSEEEVESLFPGLAAATITTAEWTMKVRGELLIRSEIEAVFRKS